MLKCSLLFVSILFFVITFVEKYTFLPVLRCQQDKITLANELMKKLCFDYDYLPIFQLCCILAFTLFRREALERHIKQHNNKLPFVCQHCPFRCKEKEILRMHNKRHFATQVFILILFFYFDDVKFVK